MVVFELMVKAELEGVAKVTFPEQWSLVVQQSGGDEQRSVIVDPSNEEDLSGSKGKCNFKIKFGGPKESYLNVVPAKKGGQEFLSAETCDEYVGVIAFDCRGLEPVEWDVKDGSFNVTATSGKAFADVSFAEGDWYDYDEDAEESVGVTNIEYKFQRR